MDFKKIVDAALIPLAIITIIGVAGEIIGSFPFLGLLLCLLGLPILIVNLAVLGWSGFRAVKDFGMDLVGGTIVGTLTGLVSFLIIGLVGFILNMLGFGASMAAGGYGGSMAATAVVGAFSVIGGIISIIGRVAFGTIAGAVFGAIGAFIAQNKK